MKTVYEYGSPSASRVLIQMVDDHDLDLIDNEVSVLQSLSGKDFHLLAVKLTAGIMICLHGMRPLFSAARRSVTVLNPRCLKFWN